MSSTTDLSISPDEAVLAGVAYADIFDFPPRFEELAFYVPIRPMSPEAIEATARDLVARGRLGERSGYLFLPGREDCVDRREAMLPVLEQKRRLLRSSLGPLLAFPWVKCVMLTGSLAANNPTDQADADLLLILDRRNMWLAYLVTRLWCRSRRSIELCPNYALSEASLTLAFKNLFTALELGKARVLDGLPLAQRFARANSWAGELMPNVPDMTARSEPIVAKPSLTARIADWVIRSPLGWFPDRLERLRLRIRTRGLYEPRRDVYKPHPPRRQLVIFQELLARLDRMGLEAVGLRRHLEQELRGLEKISRNWDQVPGKPLPEATTAVVRS